MCGFANIRDTIFACLCCASSGGQMTESLAVIIVVCATRAMPIYARLILYLHGLQQWQGVPCLSRFLRQLQSALATAERSWKCRFSSLVESSRMVFSTTRWAGSVALSSFDFIWVEDNLCVSCWSAHRCVSRSSSVFDQTM